MTILKEPQGTFINPNMCMIVNSAGRGLGLTSDPSGIAVTNNHVVTGAALLKVWMAGENTALIARNLRVFACSDLSIIDIESNGFPFLDRHAGAVDETCSFGDFLLDHYIARTQLLRLGIAFPAIHSSVASSGMCWMGAGFGRSSFFQ